MRFRESYLAIHSFCSVNGHSGPFRVVLRMLKWWGVGAEEGGIVYKGCRPGSGLATVRISETELSLCRHSGHLILDFCCSVIFTSTPFPGILSTPWTPFLFSVGGDSQMSSPPVGPCVQGRLRTHWCVCRCEEVTKIQHPARSRCVTQWYKNDNIGRISPGRVSEETALSHSVFLY